MKLQSITLTAAAIILGISSLVVSAAIEACPTRSACKAAAGEIGIDINTVFYADREGVYPVKGCYTKTNSAGVKKAFWSQGTIDEMETLLDEPLERLYCQVEVEEDKQPRVDWKAFDSNSVDENENAYSSDGFFWELDTSGSDEGTDGVQFTTESESNSNADINSAVSMAMQCSLGVVAMAIVASL